VMRGNTNDQTFLLLIRQLCFILDNCLGHVRCHYSAGSLLIELQGFLFGMKPLGSTSNKCQHFLLRKIIQSIDVFHCVVPSLEDIYQWLQINKAIDKNLIINVG
jgi:hypothetical protein